MLKVDDLQKIQNYIETEYDELINSHWLDSDYCTSECEKLFIINKALCELIEMEKE